MRIFVTLLLVLVYFQINAQSSASNDTSARSAESYDTTIYEHPEVDAKFRKGNWTDFLQKNMTYPKAAIKKEIQGTVIVKFIIETDGSVSNIQPTFGPNELREDAANLIRKSPKWMPALNNGKPVRSVRKQPIVYRL